MSGIDPDLAGMVAEFFADACGPEVLTRAEADGFLPELWKATEELGFPLVGIAEEAGGSGGSLLDLLVVLQAAGRYAVPLPLTETSLAAWLLAESGAVVPAGPMTVVTGAEQDTLALRDGRVSGTAHDVPWARGAERIVAVLDDESGRPFVVVLDAAAMAIRPGTDLAGQPRDRIDADGVPVEATAWPLPVDAISDRGSLLRCAQMAGALEEVSRLTREYVAQRVQFGQPVGRFQAVQMHVVTLAQMAVMSSLAVQRAGLAAVSGGGAFDVAAAKLVIGQNAALAARAAHQAHGAIGMTQEYRLQHFTRRLTTWRSDFGDEQALALRLGDTVLREGSVARVITATGGTVRI
jgi:acyl-CoA dehydrogenase